MKKNDIRENAIERTAAVNRRVASTVLLLAMTAALPGMMLVSCASSGSGTSGSAPAITITDFRAQNIERVRDGVIALAGDDSAGHAAKGYVKAFEDDLSMRIPTRVKTPEPVQQDPPTDPHPLWDGYRAGAFRDTTIINTSTDPAILELKRYLDGKKLEAIGDLRRYNAAFAGGGGTSSAKLGLSAAYVAIACANAPGDVETISKLVEPLLIELTPK